jgi:tRNA (guanine-N7-)-methyltransferase
MLTQNEPLRTFVRGISRCSIPLNPRIERCPELGCSGRFLSVHISSEANPNLADPVYPLPSIVNRLNLGALFPKNQPLEVELGCGDASFVAEYARRHPQTNFLGVERLLGRIRKLDRKGRHLGLTNLRGVRIESAYFLEYLLPPHSASALHLYFPDPWPKKKHHKNRLVDARFPQLARKALALEGIVYLRTDDADYFKQMTEVFGSSPLFQPIATPEDLADLLTDFEKDFHAQGIATRHAAYQRKPGL